MRTGRPRKPFWERITKGQDCWEWTGPVDSPGYGHVRWNGRNARVHRVVYQLTHGPIPPGEGHHGTVVMHSCDNKICCNPAHLRLGDHAANMADMRNKGRRKAIGRGEANGRAILTCEQVMAIQADPRSLSKIAADYPVSFSQVQRIKAGKAWVL